MAESLGCSERTVCRRLNSAGLSLRRAYTIISDAELDMNVSEINHQYPSMGTGMLMVIFSTGAFECQGEALEKV